MEASPPEDKPAPPADAPKKASKKEKPKKDKTENKPAANAAEEAPVHFGRYRNLGISVVASCNNT